MKLPLLIIVGTVPVKETPPTDYSRPIRNIVTNSESNSAPIAAHEPFGNSVLPDDLILPWSQESSGLKTYVELKEISSACNVPPMATALNERYPPIAEVSIGQRERTLASIYGETRRPRLLRIMSK